MMRFSVLDSWRGISALFVALFHLNAYGHFYSLPLVRNSYLFVDFFFVLSGFVISHTYLSRLNARGDLLPFMIRRFGRVWPLHVAMLAVFIAFPLSEWVVCYTTHVCGTAWPFQQKDVRTALSNIFLVHAMGVDDELSWNWPSWSISVEFYAYILFAVACIALRSMLVPFALVIVTISAAIIVLLSPTYMEATYDLGYFRCLFGFFLGYVVLRLYRANNLKVGRLATPLELVALLGAGTFLSLVGTSKGAIFAPLVFGCCVYVFAHEAGWISRILQGRPFLKLGRWSYSLYMVHAFILIVLLRVVRGVEKLFDIPIRLDMGYTAKLYYVHDRFLMDIVAILYLLVVIAVASLTYRMVEDPGRRYFNRLAKRIDAKVE
jgi:peptidoglycan/LPS O-acetylase OafA/YrhL